MKFLSCVLLLLKVAIQLAINRFELARLEMVLLRREVAIALILAGLGVCAIAFGSLALATLFVFLVWQSLGWSALLLVAVAYFAAAGGLLLLARRRLTMLRVP